MEEQYQTIAKRLIAEIEAGSFQVGESLPTRTVLATRFKVARATIDRAVTLLVKRGLLASSRGAGTFVAAPGRNYHFALLGGSNFPSLTSLRDSPRRKLDRIPYDRLSSKAERRTLSRFDGLIWICPDAPQMVWAAEAAGKIPQLIVNRHPDDFDFVSTDHRGAIRQITADRIDEWPDALPVFLCKKGDSGLVWGLREEGFVDACRQRSVFYEILPLPESFDDSVAMLRSRFGSTFKRRLVLVSGSLANTGAVMLWAKESGFAWGRDIRYSDFDNEYPLNVWGLRVTSFIQDWARLFSDSLEAMTELVDGREPSVRRLVMPRRVEGET